VTSQTLAWEPSNFDPETLKLMMADASKTLPPDPTQEQLLADPTVVGIKERRVDRCTSRGDDPRHGLGSGVEYALEGLLADHLGLYAFTTESIKSYLPLLDVAGKRCLTVASSGDQVIALLMAGAREVVAFDVVEATMEITALKMHALADLPWSDANQFRRDLWSTVLTPKYLAKLLDRTNENLFGSYRGLVRQAVAGLPVGRAENIFKRYQIGGYTAYASDEDSFAQARVACRDALADGRVKFMAADVRDLPLANLGEFDVINLSNIVQYKYDALGFTQSVSRSGDYNWPDGSKTKRAQDIVDTFVWPVAKMLNPGGRMMASYTYCCGSMSTNPLQRKRSRQALFRAHDGFSVEEHAWQSMSSEGGGDDVAVIVKRDQ
jgi:SAM-dependent methyltransferase